MLQGKAVGHEPPHPLLGAFAEKMMKENAGTFTQLAISTAAASGLWAMTPIRSFAVADKPSLFNQAVGLHMQTRSPPS